MVHEPYSVGGVRIKLTGKCLVVPERATQKCWLPLSNLDRVVNPTFSSAISFYQGALAPDHGRSFKDVVALLKRSLAKVLVDFYPLAGRLALCDDDGKVDLHCNDAGAVFVEAFLNISVAELGGPQPMPALSGVSMARVGPGPLYVPDQLTAMPVLIVQVTQFKCGTIALACNWHHTVADGFSGVHFMKSWAEVALGKEISVKPNHNRSLLKARNPPDHSLVREYCSGSSGSFDTAATNTAAAASISSSLAQPAILKSFPLEKDVSQELKRSIQLDNSSGESDMKPISSVEAISAHLWKVMTRARGIDSSEQPRRICYTRFFMFVDGRRRLGLPEGYFGNVVGSACAMGSEEEILNRPLSHAANLIKESVKSMTGEYFRSLIDWVEVQGLSPAKSEHVNSVGHDVAATFWTLFPLYDLDFGWGRPSFATRNSPTRPLIDGVAMMPSPGGAGNMVAIVNLHTDRMARLEGDSEFCNIYSMDRS